jgi:hypothetical protein
MILGHVLLDMVVKRTLRTTPAVSLSNPSAVPAGTTQAADAGAACAMLNPTATNARPDGPQIHKSLFRKRLSNSATQHKRLQTIAHTYDSAGVYDGLWFWPRTHH